MSKMIVLVTGGAGFIGSYTTDLLLERGYRVRILDNLEPPVHYRREKPGYIPDDVEFILGDTRDKNDTEKALQGVDVVFHLAAYQDYLTDFSKFASVNDGSTALLYEVIVNGHLPIKKVILASSQAVYGEGKYECPAHGIQYPPQRQFSQLMEMKWEVKCPVCSGDMTLLTSDELRVNPHNQYAVSKYSQELYALTLGKRFDIPTVILRYSITQGPRQSFHNAYSGILRIFTTRLLNDAPLVIYEDGQQLRDYVYVKDVVVANLMAMENETMDYQTFNVGGNQTVSVLEYAHILLDIARKDNRLQVPGEFRVGDTRHVISDISKLRTLGWEPKTPLKQIAQEYIEWAIEQPDVLDYYAEAEKVMKKEGVIRSVK